MQSHETMSMCSIVYNVTRYQCNLGPGAGSIHVSWRTRRTGLHLQVPHSTHEFPINSIVRIINTPLHPFQVFLHYLGWIEQDYLGPHTSIYSHNRQIHLQALYNRCIFILSSDCRIVSNLYYLFIEEVIQSQKGMREK